MAGAVTVGSERGNVQCETSQTTISFPNEEYECKICYNYFDLDRHTPKILGCLHTFCEECLNTLYLREDRGWRIGCPLCRRRTPVPEFRIQNLPNNTTVTDAFPLPIEEEADFFPQDSLSAHRPHLHPSLIAVYSLDEAADVRATDSQVVPTVSTANTQDSYESCQTCRYVALTTGCVCAILSFLSMLVLLFLGLIFVHNFNNPPSPIGPICLSVACILAMFSAILTWLMCWLQYRPESETRRRFTSGSTNVSGRNA